MRGKQSFNSLDVLYVELTNNCNFDCVHCGNEADEVCHLDFDVVKRLLEEFNAGTGKKLILTGGEPFLHPQLETILKTTASHKYHTKLSTNASLLNSLRFSFVLDYDIGFRVSLDGTREKHNGILGEIVWLMTVLSLQ